LIATIQRKPANTDNDDDLLRSPYENILKLGNNSMNTPTEPKPKEETYERLNYTTSAYKAPVRSTNPFDEDVRKPSLPPLPPLPQAKSAVSEERHWDNTNEYQSKYSQIFFTYSSIFHRSKL
jgi:hypothetical protein